MSVKIKALNLLLHMPTLYELGRGIGNELIREKSNQMLSDMKQDLFFQLS